MRSDERTRERAPRLVAAALAVGCALRLARPEVHSFWIDEGSTLLGAQAADFGAFLRGDSHPPLHFLFVRWWSALFGESDFALRLLPALVSSASLLLFAPLARAWLGERHAVWAVATYATAPLLVWLAHEVRVYAFVELATLLVLHAARWSWRRPGVASWSALALATALAAGVHWYGPLAAGIVVAQTLVRRVRGEIATRALAGVALACAVGVIAWLPVYRTILPAQMANEWPRIAHVRLRDVLEVPLRLVAVDLTVLVDHHVEVIGWLLGALCGAGVVAWAWRALRERTTAVLDALCAALVPVAGALVLALAMDGGFQPRYLVYAVPGTIACIAGGLASLRPRALAIAACSASLACTLAISALQLAENRREDYRTACAEVAERWQPGDRVLVIACVPRRYELATATHYWRARPDIRAAIVDRTSYLEGRDRPPSGTRLHVIYREATLCWEPFDALRRTHRFLDESPKRFRIQRISTRVP